MKFFNHKKNVAKSFSQKAGFTLIEMLVAVFVFSVVMTIAMGAIFSIVSANKTSQALKSVLDNLSRALDTMSRDVRYGSNFHCGYDLGDSGDISPKSCPEGEGGINGDTVFKFQSIADSADHRTIYTFAPSLLTDSANSIFKCSHSITPATCVRLTAQEVKITDMHFYVSNAEVGVQAQPQVLMTISGYAQAGANHSEFNIETMVDQRNLKH